MTLRSCVNYITKNSVDTIVISGVKFANNVTLTDVAYANVPIPKYICVLRNIYLEIYLAICMQDVCYMPQSLEHNKMYTSFRLTIPLCAMGVMTLEIQTSSITVGDLIVKNLNVSRLLGANNLNNTVFDSASALHSIDFSEKLFAGKVSVKKVSTSKIGGMDVRGKKKKFEKINSYYLN